jgi:hypothetical protein
MARNLHRRKVAVGWHVFGLMDLVLAIVLGAITTPGAAHLVATTPSAAAMTAFPMAVVPAFLVPLSIALHLLSLRYLQTAGDHSTPMPATVLAVRPTKD